MPHRALTPNTTYTLAHTAQCKLKLAANRPDRNLRFVLGHAFTLDNLMLRIVEIENHSAKSAFEEGNESPGGHGDEQYNCTAIEPAGKAVHHGSSPAKPGPSARGRRISFQDNRGRPSSTAGVESSNHSSSSAGRKRSPPPTSVPAAEHTYLDEGGSDETSSSDDYDDPATTQYDYSGGSAEPEARSPKRRPFRDAYSDEEDEALELADDEFEGSAAGGEGNVNEQYQDGLSLRRFDSAASQPPRLVQSSSSSSTSSEDENEPVSPPQLPTDVDVKELVQGEQDAELTDLYESVRRCRCHGQSDNVGGPPAGVWDVPAEKTGGKRLAVVAVAT